MSLTYRDATAADLGLIIALIVDDSVVATGDNRHHTDDPRYLAGLAAIDADPNNELLVALLGAEPVGTLQLTFIPGIARVGQWRCLVEHVHILPDYRNRGFGAAMMTHAIARAKQRGCGLVQLTSNKARKDAHRFYERLGFVATHEGFKLKLEAQDVAADGYLRAVGHTLSEWENPEDEEASRDL